MQASFQHLLNQARHFITGDGFSDSQFRKDFRFASPGRLAYELVLDASPSMDDNDYPPSRFAAAKQAATGFLQKCVAQTPDALVGVIFYAESARIATPLSPSKAQYGQLLSAIESGRIAPATNIGTALITAGQELTAKGVAVSPVVLLLTDGHSNTGPDPVQIASDLKEMGVRLDIIGIGGSPSDVNESELKRMASILEGQSRYWFIRDTHTLVRKFEALALGRV